MEPKKGLDALSQYLHDQDNNESKTGEKGSLDLFRQRIYSESDSPSKNQEGGYLSSREIINNLRTVLKEEGYPQYIANYFVERFLSIPQEQIRELLEKSSTTMNLGPNERADLRRDVEAWQVYRDKVLRTIVQNPNLYGVDKEVLASGGRPPVPPIEHFNETLNNISHEEVSVTRDDEYFFYSNGMELPFVDITNVSRELLAQVAPEGKEGEKWVNIFANECLQPFFNRLSEYRYFKDDSVQEKTAKAAKRREIHAELALFLKEVVVEGKFADYAKVILDGESFEDQKAHFPDLELRLPKRVRDEISRVPKERRAEKNRIKRDFFAKRIEEGGEDYIGKVKEQYLNQDPQALNDEAGPKWLVLFTEEINFLLKEAGYQPNEIDDQYGSEDFGRYIDTRVDYLSQRTAAERELNKLSRDPNASDQDVKLARKKLQMVENDLKKNDQDIVTIVAAMVNMPAVFKAKNAGKGTNRKMLENYSDGSSE